MTRSSWRRSAWTMLVFSVLALPALAALQSRDARPFLNGVDRNGNPSAQIGSRGYGKIYYESNTNILVNVGGAIISNRYGRPVVFNNQGGTLNNPFNGTNYPITSDQQIVLPSFLALSLSTIVQVYDPTDH